jgi:hypothetical protein
MTGDTVDGCPICGVGPGEHKHNLSPAQWIECRNCGFKLSDWDETWTELVIAFETRRNISSPAVRFFDVCTATGEHVEVRVLNDEQISLTSSGWFKVLRGQHGERISAAFYRPSKVVEKLP